MKWLIKQVLPIIVWIAVSELLIWANPPNWRPVRNPEFFRICVMDNNEPKTIVLPERKPNQTLCTETHFQAENYPLRFDLKYLSQENMWELTTSNDSLSDPHIYRYRVDNQQITPLAYTYGGMASKISTYVAVLILMVFMSKLWSLGRWLWKKFRPHTH